MEKSDKAQDTLKKIPEEPHEEPTKEKQPDLLTYEETILEGEDFLEKEIEENGV